MKERIRVILVDDHAMVRRGFRKLLEEHGTMAVVAEAGDAMEGLAAVAGVGCDVAVVDFSLPGPDGLWLTRQLHTRHPLVRVLILTVRTEEGTALEALRAGAHGYLTKMSRPEDLITAIEQIHHYGGYLHPTFVRPVLAELQSPSDRSRTMDGRPITERERDILAEAAAGLGNKDIATRLTLSESTVKSHLRSIYRKLGTLDRTQAILHAIRTGLIDDPKSVPKPTEV